MSALHAPPETARVFTPARVGPLTLRNRVVKCGTNEGLSRDGLVTEPLIDWHREVAAGGVAMTTLAYCSVSADGRTFPHQIWMREEALPGLARFAEAMHAEGARAAIQIGHAGWFASPRAIRARPVGPSRTFSPHAGTFSRAATEADLARLTGDFADAARLAARAGFDGIEVHLGHGYLLSQFLTPWNNRRDDAWGGSLENRARFPRQVLRAVRGAAGSEVAIWPKLNMTDGFRGGLRPDDAVQVARWIEADGSVDALQLTGGHTTRSPFFLLRGDAPRREMIADQPHWGVRLGMRLAGPFLLRAWPFEEAFFLPLARRFREAVDLPLMLLGGVNRLDTMERAMAEGFTLVALGRALLRDPDLVERLRSGELEGSRCIHCNLCIVEMDRGGTRCPLREEPPGLAAGRA